MNRILLAALQKLTARWVEVPHMLEPDKEDGEVLRIQNSKGEGPFQERDAWIDEGREGHISPFEDTFGPGMEDMLSEAQDAEEGQLLYGFKDEKQMKAYFSETELEKMSELGYKPTTVPADYIWYGKHQVVFTPENWREG